MRDSALAAYREFLQRDGRGLRRLIGFPSPLYTEDFEALLAVAKEIIASGHEPSISAALSSLEVDLCWAHFWHGLSKSIDTGHQETRIIRRLTQVIELLAANRLGSISSSQIYHQQDLERIVPAIDVASSELARYVAKRPHLLHSLEPRQFEELIAEVLSHFGWSVELTPYSKDGGVDLLCVSSDKIPGPKTSLIVECKKYRPENKVGIEVARQLIFVKNDLKAGNAMLVTSSDFTRGVYDFQSARLDLDLRNFESVIEWCSTVDKSRR